MPQAVASQFAAFELKHVSYCRISQLGLAGDDCGICPDGIPGARGDPGDPGLPGTFICTVSVMSYLFINIFSILIRHN